MSEQADTSRPRRVLHIGKYFPPHPGGMETYLRDLMNVQKRQGLEVMALVHASERRLFDTDESVDALDDTSYQVMRSARWFNLGFVPVSPGFIWSAFKAVKYFKPDVIHIHHPNASACWLLLLAAAKNIPWLIHWHSDISTADSGVAVRFSYFFYRHLESKLLRHAGQIVTTSEPYLQSSPALKAHRQKCCVIPLGIDSRRLPSPKEVTPRDTHGRAHIAFVGRLVPYKGLSHLLHALEAFPDLQCWIAGDGQLYKAMARDITERGLQGRVELLGAVSEEGKWSVLKACKALVLPSIERTEAFGIVQLEAAHFGKPVVVTDVSGSGMGWVADQLELGLVAQSRDSSDLVAKIKLALAMESLNSDGTHSTLPTVFNLEDQVCELQALYLEACSLPQPSELPAERQIDCSK